MKDYSYDLGVYTWPVSTKSHEAQRWFDRGLNWTFAYNHEEAGVCFNKALESDPDFAMAHRGLAYIIGPNYNNPWELFDDQQMTITLTESRKSIANAKACMSNASPVEQALISALAHRYQSEKPVEDMYQWSRDYSNQMSSVYNDFPDNPDVATFYAEALMNLSPWKLWDPKTGIPVEGAETLHCKEVLEKAIAAVAAKGPARHPGLLHLYIHLMEMSSTPEEALIVADDLRHLVPDGGHLKHMSTHIIAHAALKNHSAALQSQSDFHAATEKISDERYIHVVSCKDILAVAAEMLAGEISYHHGDYDKAFEHLRKAVRCEDNLPYDEPWGWMMPSRHALGALLLEQGHIDEAASTYEADLGLNDKVIRSNQHPDNVWALAGLYECYQKQGKQREARMLKPRRDFALARADANIRVSCFCSMKNKKSKATPEPA